MASRYSIDFGCDQSVSWYRLSGVPRMSVQFAERQKFVSLLFNSDELEELALAFAEMYRRLSGRDVRGFHVEAIDGNAT